MLLISSFDRLRSKIWSYPWFFSFSLMHFKWISRSFWCCLQNHAESILCSPPTLLATRPKSPPSLCKITKGLSFPGLPFFSLFSMKWLEWSYKNRSQIMLLPVLISLSKHQNIYRNRQDFTRYSSPFLSDLMSYCPSPYSVPATLAVLLLLKETDCTSSCLRAFTWLLPKCFIPDIHVLHLHISAFSLKL